jgi:antitoxin (DNA-binding transcriptional repressor) of toxin-antitoxin stability system
MKHMNTISVQDIQRDPSTFLRRLESGESFLVVREEQPLAEVRPLVKAAASPRPFGLCAGQFSVPDDFDRPLPDEILKEFEGE